MVLDIKKKVKVTTKTLAYDEPISETILYDQPKENKKISRVAGPFTVEAVPAPTVTSIDEIENPSNLNKREHISNLNESTYQSEWRDLMLRTGIRTTDGKRMRFTRLDTFEGSKDIHAEGEIELVAVNSNRNKQEIQKVAVRFGSPFHPINVTQIMRTKEVVESMSPSPQLVIFASFQFDPVASKFVGSIRSSTTNFMQVNMNSDLLTKDLRMKDTT